MARRGVCPHDPAVSGYWPEGSRVSYGRPGYYLWSVLTLCASGVVGSLQITTYTLKTAAAGAPEIKKIMSTYYANLLPPNLGGGHSTSPQDHFAEAKYEAGFYNNSGSTGQPPVTGYESDTQHPGLPRFPPYDRLDIRPITSKQGFTPTTTAGYQVGLGYPPSAHQNGHYGPPGSAGDDPGSTGCKLPITTPQDAALLQGNHTPNGQLHNVPPFGAGGLGGMVNGVHTAAQSNLPIYPWMRPVNGGKYYDFYNYSKLSYKHQYYPMFSLFICP